MTKILFELLLIFSVIKVTRTISSPISPLNEYVYSTELETNVADIWWTIDDLKKEIVFELHVKTTGWIALGISPAGGMKGADIAVGWVNSTGHVQLQDRYAIDTRKPVLDNTTNDWFPIQGREQNGWTVIQFKRLLDTCDYMDVPIKSGTNILIYAYGLNDPVNDDITYHGTRRGSRIIPLQSYSVPPQENKFAHLDPFELRMNNFLIPPNDTTYHCQVFKLPSHFTAKRHAIAHQIIVDPRNVQLVHHMDLYECELETSHFNDENLPSGDCDAIIDSIKSCFSSIVAVWSVGGDTVSEYISTAGYPIAGQNSVKYFMLQIHYDNSQLLSNRYDSSGIKFYVDTQLRPHDLGYLSFGVVSNAYGLAIPPLVDRFMVDSYCLSSFSQDFPCDGINVISSFPHTHLQGRSVWTKLIRDNKVVDYLFNAESFDFNYQFENRLRNPIILYPGDEFVTRCVFSTSNKNEITLGGERTKDEMCIHVFMYYPRIENKFFCRTQNSLPSWQNFLNQSWDVGDNKKFREYLFNLEWTPDHTKRWQQFYDKSPRAQLNGGGGVFHQEIIENLPDFEDLVEERCSTSS